MLILSTVFMNIDGRKKLCFCFKILSAVFIMPAPSSRVSGAERCDGQNTSYPSIFKSFSCVSRYSSIDVACARNISISGLNVSPENIMRSLLDKKHKLPSVCPGVSKTSIFLSPRSNVNPSQIGISSGSF